MEELLSAVLEHLGPIIIGVLGTLVAYYARLLVKKHGDKLDVETKAKLDEMITSLTSQGVAFAEQWAKNKAKDGGRVPGNEKLHKAMEYVAGQVEKYNLDKLAEEELKEKIESILGYGTLNEIQLETSLGIEEDNNGENWDN